MTKKKPPVHSKKFQDWELVIRTSVAVVAVGLQVAVLIILLNRG